MSELSGGIRQEGSRAAGDAADDRAPAEPVSPARAEAPLTGSHPMERPSLFAALRVRDYRLLWLAQLGTTMGLWMDQTTRGWLIYILTGSAVDLGLVSAMRALPTLAFGVVAGVLADRYDRKRQLVLSQMANAVLNLILAVLVTTGQVEPWHVYVTALLAGFVQTFQQPARQSMVSDLVPKRLLTNAIALNSAVFNLSRTLGPAFAGFLISAVGTDGSYYVQAVMYVFATIWTVQMVVPDRDALRSAATGLASFRDDLMEGLRYIASEPRIRSLMWFGLVPTLIAMPFVGLMPIFAKDILQIGAQGQGLLLTAAGTGALIGSLGFASFGNSTRKGWVLLVSAGLFGFFLMGFALSTSVPLSLAMLCLVGLTNTTFGSQDQTIIQILAPGPLRGRILSLYLMNRGLSPLGGLVAGAVAAWLGGPAAVFLMGLTTFGLVLLAIWRAPLIRNLDI